LHIVTADKYRTYLLKSAKHNHIATTNGATQSQYYLMLHLKHGDQIIHAKFWVLDIPFPFLIGRNLIHILGYRLSHYDSFKDEPDEIDTTFNDSYDTSNHDREGNPMEKPDINLNDREGSSLNYPISVNHCTNYARRMLCIRSMMSISRC
jgi:hypothetical protein